MFRSVFTIIFIGLILGSFCYGQTNQLTPIQAQQASNMQSNLEKASAFEANLPDSALHYYNKVIPPNIHDETFYNQWISEAPDVHKYFVAVALAQSGRINLGRNNISIGIRNLHRAYELSISINNDDLAKFCSDNLAVFYAQTRDFNNALKYFENSLKIYRKQNDINGRIYCKGNLGAIHANMGNLYGAAYYYEQLLNMQIRHGLEIETIDEIINIAMLYNRLQDNEKAVVFWGKALEESIKRGQNDKLGLIYSNIGAAHYNLKRYENALYHYSLYLEYAEKQNNINEQVNALNNIAIIYYHLKNLRESAQAWEQTLSLAMKTGQGQIVFDALINLSSLYSLMGNNEKSIKFYEQYLALARQVNDPIFNARAIFGMGEIQYQAGNYQNAREHFANAQNAFIELNDTLKAAEINNLIAKTYFNENNLYEGLAYFRKNLDVEILKNSIVLAESFQGIADTYRRLRQLEIASGYYYNALNIYTAENRTDKASSTLNSLAYIQEINGNLPKAVEYYERAFNLAKISANKDAEAAILNNLGIVYRQLGDLPRAFNSYSKAMDIYQQTNNQDAIAYCYNNLGIIFELSGDYETASNYYEKSLSIKQYSDDIQGLATSLLNIGNIQKLQGNANRAKTYYERALKLSEEINDIQGVAVVLINLAALYMETGEFHKAVEYAERSRKLSEQSGFLTTLRESYRQLATAFFALGEFNNAESAFIKVIHFNHEEIDRNFSILSESEKELFFNTVEEDFARFHSFALDRVADNPEISGHVYNNLLKNKGLLLKSSTAMRNAILSSGDAGLIRTYEQWIQIKQEIAQLYTLPIDERHVNVELLEERANNLERSLVRNSVEFSQFDESANITWNSIKENLDSNAVAIEFTSFMHYREVVYCALIIGHKWETPVFIPLFKESELENIMGILAGNNYIYINNLYGRLTQSEVKLFELIWLPLKGYLENISKVHLSPSGLLHKVSFAAISRGLGQFICDDYDIYNLSTTAQIITSKDLIFNDETKLTLFGGINYTIHSIDNSWKYLDGTLKEIDIIKQIGNDFFGSIAYYTGNHATEEKFKNVAPGSNILHIATHGFFYPDPELIDDMMDFDVMFEDVEFRGGIPAFGLNNFVRNTNPLMRSGLVFAGVNDYWSGSKAVTGDDGVLTALEVINIDLRKTDLAVMSACETGLGEIKGSEGVYGLQRAFKMAGVNYLVMSLWQVPDKETAEFMTLFYRYLIQGNSIHQAFATAQRDMREKYDPFFWAAFVLIE